MGWENKLLGGLGAHWPTAPQRALKIALINWKLSLKNTVYIFLLVFREVYCYIWHCFKYNVHKMFDGQFVFIWCHCTYRTYIFWQQKCVRLIMLGINRVVGNIKDIIITFEFKMNCSISCYFFCLSYFFPRYFKCQYIIYFCGFCCNFFYWFS